MIEIKSFLRKLKNILHLIEAIIANFFYGFPAKKIKVIGVTGTDGKTTTTHLIYHILKTAGKKVSMISTIYGKVGDKKYDTGLHTTTPSSFLIQKLLNKAVKDKNDYFVLEVTSHGLDQNRVWGINFEVGVLTNITHEHLDYHGTYFKYVKAKEKLLLNSKNILLNPNDLSYSYLSQSVKNKAYDYTRNINFVKKHFELPKFNQYNFAAALTATKILGISEKIILQALKTFKLPKGRWEIVWDKNIKVIVDFAHTPNAFSQILPEIKKRYLKKNGRLIHVFGAAGLRDFTKREIMGEISAKYSKVIIITEEDYRTESPLEIANQIAKGIIKKKFNYIDYHKLNKESKKVFTIVINRKKAIDLAFRIAKKNDILLFTGKAHEKSLCRGKVEYDWNEFLAIKESLRHYYKNGDFIR